MKYHWIPIIMEFSLSVMRRQHYFGNGSMSSLCKRAGAPAHTGKTIHGLPRIELKHFGACLCMLLVCMPVSSRDIPYTIWVERESLTHPGYGPDVIDIQEIPIYEDKLIEHWENCDIDLLEAGFSYIYACDQVWKTVSEQVGTTYTYKRRVVNVMIPEIITHTDETPEDITEDVPGIDDVDNQQTNADNLSELTESLDPDPITDNLDDTKDRERADRITDEDEVSNSVTGGDPVRLTTGEFVTSVSDMFMMLGVNSVDISRHYDKGIAYGQTFGSAWHSELDTRIVRGINDNAQSDFDDLDDMYRTALSAYQQAYADYTTSLTTIQSVIDALNEVKTELATGRNTLQDAQNNLGTSDTDAHKKLQEYIDSITQRITSINTLLAEWETQQHNAIMNVLPQIQSAERHLQNIEAQRDAFHNYLVHTQRNTSLNAVSTQDTDFARSFINGVDTLTLISPRLQQVQFSYDSQPDYSAAMTYPGTDLINYYPAGSTFTALYPNQGELKLTPYGKFIYTDTDQSRYRYNHFGQLEQIQYDDLSTITVTHDAQGNLTELTDHWGRSISAQYNTAGNIITLTDPAGHDVTYRYTADGYLRQVTYPNDDTIAYTYRDDRLTSIIKPDASRIQYTWTELTPGDFRVTSVSDEENAEETFSYNTGDNRTTYTSPSGVSQRHYFDSRYRETRIEYEDGSAETFLYDRNNNQIQATRRNGAVITRAYNNSGNITAVTDETGNTEAYRYDTANRLTSFTDKNGDTTGYTYDTAGNLTRITHPDLNVIQIQYGDYGLPVVYENEEGEQTTYTYDSSGHIASVTDGEGSTWAYTHDILGNLLTETDPAGALTTHTYDTRNRRIRTTYPDASVERWEYSNRGDLSSFTDTAGYITAYTYDKRHLLRSITNPLGETTQYTYRPDRMQTEQISPAGYRMIYTYNTVGRLSEISYPDAGEGMRYTYDPAGTVSSITDSSGGAHIFSYNARDELIRAQYPDGSTESFTYTPRGEVSSHSDADGYLWQYTYDSRGRLVAEIDPASFATTYTYDRAGRMRSIRDPEGHIRRYEYNAQGLVTRITDPQGNSEGFTYDSRMNRTGYTDTEGHIWAYHYDVINRLIGMTDPENYRVHYEYDAQDNRTRHTDADGGTHVYGYDRLQRITAITDPAGHTEYTAYDSEGNVSSSTDKDGSTWNYTHDAQGRMTSAQAPDGGQVRYAYDTRGQLTAVTNELGHTTRYQYDSVGNMVMKTDGEQQRYEYTYNNRRQLIGETDGSGKTHRYEYDARGQMIREVNRLGRSQRYEYDARGLLTDVYDFNGTRIQYTYDDLERVTGEYADGVVQSSFQYDGRGNIIRAVNDTASLSFTYDRRGYLTRSSDSLSDTRQSYTYNGRGLLTTHRMSEAAQPIRYTYNARSDITSITDPSGGVNTYTYNTRSQVTRVDRAHGLNDIYTYDSNGRQTSHLITEDSRTQERRVQGESYVYNTAGQRIFKVSETGDYTRYSYDAAGRLTEVLYPIGNNKEFLPADMKAATLSGFYTGETESGRDHIDFDELDPPASAETTVLPGGDVLITGETDTAYWGILRLVRESENGTFLPMNIRTSDSDTPSPTPPVNIGSPHKDRYLVTADMYTRIFLDNASRNSVGAALDRIAPDVSLDSTLLMWPETFTYDSRGNRTSARTPWGIRLSTYDDDNRLITEAGTSYTYDHNGNAIEETAEMYTIRSRYTYDNRLYSLVKTTADRTEYSAYRYDALRRRVHDLSWYTRADHRITGLLDDTRHAYRGLSLNRVAGVSRSGKLSSENTHTSVSYHGVPDTYRKRYTTDRNGIISSHMTDDSGEGGAHNYYHTDVLGSTVLSVERGRQYRVDYDAFGSQITGKPQFDFSYNGKRRDQVTGVYDYGFREYAAAAGRFSTRDPIRDGTNWYSYVRNDPVNYIDPLGLRPVQAAGTADRRSSPPSFKENEGADRPSPSRPDTGGAPSNRSNSDEIHYQKVFDPTAFHCDAIAWNTALSNGYDPRPPDGQTWNANTITVPQIRDIYTTDNLTISSANIRSAINNLPEHTRPQAGYLFSGENGNSHIEFVEFIYDEDGMLTGYTEYDTDGIDDPQDFFRSPEESFNTPRSFVFLDNL